MRGAGATRAIFHFRFLAEIVLGFCVMALRQTTLQPNEGRLPSVAVAIDHIAGLIARYRVPQASVGFHGRGVPDLQWILR